MFVHLHNHTEYSLLDGASRIGEFVQLAAQMEMPALAITDHGVLYGALPFYRAAREHGIKPIIGCEVYVAPRGRTMRDPKLDASSYHLVLLATDQTGYKNLLALSSLGFLEGFYYKPRVDKELLAKHSGGLIALSACLGGEIPKRIMAGDLEGAKKAAIEYREIFGRENFFLELQDQGLPEQPRVNAALIQLGQELGLELVATGDTHYLKKGDAEIHDVLLCIQTGKTLADTERMRFETSEFYFKSPHQMQQLFSHVPEALTNTLKIADRCQLELEFGGRHLPRFPLPQGTDAAGFLRQIAHDGALARYGAVEGEVETRLHYELGIIEKMGFCDYFLIVWDFMRFAKEQDIIVGPGRGSAAGSLVAYSLGITQLDPLRWGLLFERFLNPQRVSMPDIDTDFCQERRGEVLDYVVQRYGEDHVAQIITFDTLAAKRAVRDVGRVLDLPARKVDQVAKLIPDQTALADAMTIEEKIQQLAREDPQVQRLLEVAQAIEGFPRNSSTHAAGVVITDEPLLQCTPLQRDGTGPVITQYPMGQLEEIGLLKMDFLGLRNLTVLRRAAELAGGVDLDKIPIDESEVYQMLSRGESMGVFQLESQMFQQLLREVQPRRLEDIIAIVSLGRPGPLAMVPEYVRGKADPQKISYLDPALEPILKETYGVMVYQEQVMRIASTIAGFSLAEADLLRRAMGKKKPQEIAALKERFLEGAREHGLEEKQAEKIFKQIEDFAGYGFNKSHAAAYALVAYQTAYMRHFFPAPYMAALLSSEKSNLKKIVLYMNSCRKMGLEVLPPDINTSGADFTVEGEKIRFGLSAIKNVGLGAVEEIIGARREGPFTSLADLCGRVDLRSVNRRVLESLIYVGACQSLYPNRRALILNLDEAMRYGEAQRRERNSSQGSLFDDFVSPPPMPGIEDFPSSEQLAFEKEYLGIFLSGHPLDKWESLLADYAVPILALDELPDGNRITTVGGIIVAIREITTKKGQRMAYVTVEDLGGTVELVVFPRTFAKCQSYLEVERVVIASGRLERGEGNNSSRILADTVIPTDEGLVQLELPKARGQLASLRQLLERTRGGIPVILELRDRGTRWLLSTDPNLWAEPQLLASRLQEEPALRYSLMEPPG